MRKYIAVITGTMGFFIATGAGGGIECDSMTWGQALAWTAVGFAMMGASVICARRCR